jgi:hypothetical protein
MYAPSQFCKRRMRVPSAWVVVRGRVSGMSTATALTRIHRYTCPDDPPSTIRGEECDHGGGKGWPLILVTDSDVGLPSGKTDQVCNGFFSKPQVTGLVAGNRGFRYRVARWSHLGHRKPRPGDNVLLYALEYLRSDEMSFLAPSESGFAPDACMSDPVV